MNRLCLVLALLTICFISAPFARADTELSLAVGAGQLRADGPLDDNWGPWVEPSISFTPFPDLQSLRLGVGAGFGYFTQDITVSLDIYSSSTLEMELLIITPEALVSWRQPLGNKFYIEPGVGVGVMIGYLYAFGDDVSAGYSIRPFVRLGYDAGRWTAGLEAGYQFGSLDLGELDDVQVLNLGAFFTFKI
jgi:hypothetical protein